jgi:hypothetical protein
MRKLLSVTVAVLAMAVVRTPPAAGQMGGNVTVEPFVGYGFFGDLPETGINLESAFTFGGRAAYRFAPQWAGFATFQRSTPSEINVDHWSAGIEFAYAPRGGAEGVLPVLLEVGLGQARYQDGPSDFAANIGVASALQLTPNFAIRYGANDYISNYDGDNGVVNQVFVRIGGELRF